MIFIKKVRFQPKNVLELKKPNKRPGKRITDSQETESSEYFTAIQVSVFIGKNTDQGILFRNPPLSCDY